MTDKRQEITFEVENDPNFQVAHIDGALGILNQNVGQMILFYDIPEYTMGLTPVGTNPEMKVETVKRIVVLDIRTSPEVFKSIAIWMNDRVKEYEGIIKSGAPTQDGQTYYQ